MTQPLLVAKGEKNLFIPPKMSKRHGLIAGATETGKTVTLQVLVENFSRIGVPAYMHDVKGALAGTSKPWKEHPPNKRLPQRKNLEEKDRVSRRLWQKMQHGASEDR